MKINEKSLSRYAGSGAPPDREGHLSKRGDFNRGYQKRWFVLKGNLLFYYEKKIDKDPIGVIILEGCTVELSDDQDGFTFMLNFPGSNTRTYVLSADTQEEMEAWMKVLSGASYDYMKICVNELKHQLHDLETSAEKQLIKGAIKDRKTLIQTGLVSVSETRASSASGACGSGPVSQPVPSSMFNNSITIRRHNPFDSEESFDRDTASDIGERQTLIEKQTRDFLEMHEELRIQIIEITAEWLRTNPSSKACLLKPQSVV